jgi:hypothetical protein
MSAQDPNLYIHAAIPPQNSQVYDQTQILAKVGSTLNDPMADISNKDISEEQFERDLMDKHNNVLGILRRTRLWWLAVNRPASIQDMISGQFENLTKKAESIITADNPNFAKFQSVQSDRNQQSLFFHFACYLNIDQVYRIRCISRNPMDSNEFVSFDFEGGLSNAFISNTLSFDNNELRITQENMVQVEITFYSNPPRDLEAYVIPYDSFVCHFHSREKFQPANCIPAGGPLFEHLLVSNENQGITSDSDLWQGFMNQSKWLFLFNGDPGKHWYLTTPVFRPLYRDYTWYGRRGFTKTGRDPIIHGSADNAPYDAYLKPFSPINHTLYHPDYLMQLCSANLTPSCPEPGKIDFQSELQLIIANYPDDGSPFYSGDSVNDLQIFPVDWYGNRGEEFQTNRNKQQHCVVPGPREAHTEYTSGQPRTSTPSPGHLTLQFPLDPEILRTTKNIITLAIYQGIADPVSIELGSFGFDELKNSYRFHTSKINTDLLPFDPVLTVDNHQFSVSWLEQTDDACLVYVDNQEVDVSSGEADNSEAPLVTAIAKYNNQWFNLLKEAYGQMSTNSVEGTLDGLFEREKQVLHMDLTLPELDLVPLLLPVDTIAEKLQLSQDTTLQSVEPTAPQTHALRYLPSDETFKVGITDEQAILTQRDPAGSTLGNNQMSRFLLGFPEGKLSIGSINNSEYQKNWEYCGGDGYVAISKTSDSLQYIKLLVRGTPELDNDGELSWLTISAPDPETETTLLDLLQGNETTTIKAIYVPGFQVTITGIPLNNGLYSTFVSHKPDRESCIVRWTSTGKISVNNYRGLKKPIVRGIGTTTLSDNSGYCSAAVLIELEDPLPYAIELERGLSDLDDCTNSLDPNGTSQLFLSQPIIVDSPTQEDNRPFQRTNAYDLYYFGINGSSGRHGYLFVDKLVPSVPHAGVWYLAREIPIDYEAQENQLDEEGTNSTEHDGISDHCSPILFVPALKPAELSWPTPTTGSETLEPLKSEEITLQIQCTIPNQEVLLDKLTHTWMLYANGYQVDVSSVVTCESDYCLKILRSKLPQQFATVELLVSSVLNYTLDFKEISQDMDSYFENLNIPDLMKPIVLPFIPEEQLNMRSSCSNVLRIVESTYYQLPKPLGELESDIVRSKEEVIVQVLNGDPRFYYRLALEVSSGVLEPVGEWISTDVISPRLKLGMNPRGPVEFQEHSKSSLQEFDTHETETSITLVVQCTDQPNGSSSKPEKIINSDPLRVTIVPMNDDEESEP